MPRRRVTLPHLPLHVIQRGNNRRVIVGKRGQAHIPSESCSVPPAFLAEHAVGLRVAVQSTFSMLSRNRESPRGFS